MNPFTFILPYFRNICETFSEACVVSRDKAKYFYSLIIAFLLVHFSIQKYKIQKYVKQIPEATNHAEISCTIYVSYFKYFYF